MLIVSAVVFKNEHIIPLVCPLSVYLCLHVVVIYPILLDR